MQPSSRIALAVAAVLAALSIGFYFLAQDTPAPELTRREVGRMLNDIASAIRRKDVDRAMAYTTPDALLFGETRRRLEQFARRSLRDASFRRVEIAWNNLVVTARSDKAIAEFDVTVGERMGSMDAVYFASHITLHFRKTVQGGVLGLGRREVWMIERADSTRDLYTGE